MLKGVKKYAKKILYFLGFAVTGIVLYILLTRNQSRTNERINSDITGIHKSNKRIKDYLDTATKNSRDIKDKIRDAANDNSTALAIVSRIERTNERFRKLLFEIQENSDG